MQVPGEWYEEHSASRSLSLLISPAACFFLAETFSLFEIPEGIGPAGINTVGRCPNCNAPMRRPGTILSQTPSMIAPSNIWCESAIAVALAMVSRLNRLSSMPSWPCVMPSHMAGTPPATWAVPPALFIADLIFSG